MYLHLAFVVSILMLGLAANAQDTDVNKSASFNDSGINAATGIEQLEELGLLSAALVEKAGSGSSPAHEFRIQARMYRELLRQAMLSDSEKSPREQLPQDLLLEMVRMSALLHSAADCKTGFVITCPADLMLQLKSQQGRVDQGLKMSRMIRE